MKFIKDNMKYEEYCFNKEVCFLSSHFIRTQTYQNHPPAMEHRTAHTLSHDSRRSTEWVGGPSLPKVEGATDTLNNEVTNCCGRKSIMQPTMRLWRKMYFILTLCCRLFTRQETGLQWSYKNPYRSSLKTDQGFQGFKDLRRLSLLSFYKKAYRLLLPKFITLESCLFI